MDLPDPLDDDPARPYTVAMVCLGNICRSPTAAVVLEHRLAIAGVDGVAVESAGTGPWHVGEAMHPASARALTDAGYDATRHRGRQVDTGWFDRCDLLLTMDAANHADVLALARTDAERDRVRPFRSYDPLGGPDAEVPDPWGGGAEGFAEVLQTVERTGDVLVDLLAGRDGTVRDRP